MTLFGFRQACWAESLGNSWLCSESIWGWCHLCPIVEVLYNASKNAAKPLQKWKHFVFDPVLVPAICSFLPPLKSLWLRRDWAVVCQVTGRELWIRRPGECFDFFKLKVKKSECSFSPWSLKTLLLPTVWRSCLPTSFSVATPSTSVHLLSCIVVMPDSPSHGQELTVPCNRPAQ